MRSMTAFRVQGVSFSDSAVSLGFVVARFRGNLSKILTKYEAETVKNTTFK